MRRAHPSLAPAIVLERCGPLTPQRLWLGLPGRGRHRLREVMPDQEAAQAIGTWTNRAFQRLEVVRAGPQPRRLLQRVQLVEGLLEVSGVIGILAGRTRVIRPGDAP